MRFTSLDKFLISIVMFVVLFLAMAPRTNASTSPVVLLHGGGALGVMGQAQIQPMADALTSAGYTVYNLGLPSVSNCVENALYVKSYVDSNHLTNFHLVGYSIGGLEARYYAKGLGGAAKALDVTTIDSPNNGDWLLSFFDQTLSPLGICAITDNFGDDTPGTLRYSQLLNSQGYTYVMDGGVCLIPINAPHAALPASPDVQQKVIAFLNGMCPGTFLNAPIK